MSSQYRVLKNVKTGQIILARTRWCASFWSKFRGLQFVFHLPEDEGLLFVSDAESRTATSIHMFFMFFSIGVVWLDRQGKVVDMCYAKPWRPMYVSKKPAQYFIEANPSILERVKIGDRLSFEEVVA